MALTTFIARPPRRMAEQEVQKCLRWLLDQKENLEGTPYGENKAAVDAASGAHGRWRAQLNDYRKSMDKLNNVHRLRDDEVEELYGTYKDLQTLSEKKSNCFNVMSNITALEEQIQSLGSEVDARAVHLVNMAANNRSQTSAHLNNESMAENTQRCLTGVRKAWRWLDEMMQCTHVHLANAAAYHEFFHEVEEVDHWLASTMSQMHLTFARARMAGHAGDLNGIRVEIKDTMLAYLRWQSKVDGLFTRARDIVPVHRRTTPVIDQCQVTALASYNGPQIQFQEGETLTLLDNSDRKEWRVRNSRDQVGVVPAVIILISGPSGEAVDAAVRLRLQLLGLWTSSVKRLGYQMIAFMQLVFKDWNEEEIKAIQRMPEADRRQLSETLSAVDEELGRTWRGYPGFEDLQERMSRLQTILEEANSNPPPPSTGSNGEVVVQAKMLDDLLSQYKTHNRLPTVLFRRFWDTNLELPNGDGKTYKAEAALILQETPRGGRLQPEVAVEETMTSEAADRTDSTVSDAMAKLTIGDEDEDQWTSSTEVTEVRRRQQLTTDEVVQSTEEVRHTYIIKSVYDPRTQENISLTEAVVAGIIDQVAGRYVDIVTGTSVSYQEAMANGDITVEFKSQRKVREERSSYGIITVRTSRESRPYTVTAVTDPATDKQLSPDAAYEKGILSKTEPIYIGAGGERMPLLDAIYVGHVQANFLGTPDESEEETITYAVNGVIDQRKRDKLSFHDAISQGLLDAEEGVYVNNVTWERVPITDAIMKGLIKAKIITDTSSLDIDPTNKIVVQRLGSVKEKILKAVKTARAFKMNVPELGK
ncbi:DESP-like protein [Mya arenaria]|uniref:DESP-like protein n=1 Tax=Mya arenaria TaxID=6604 RepID=A0ABY7G4A4_MYAAR|nr:DESP-like protein [Mya arenaria]